MKVIATAGDGKFICEVSQKEIRDFLKDFYSSSNLELGKTYDLSRGHDFMKETKKALETTKAFIKDNAVVINSIMKGINVMGKPNEQK